VAPSCGRAVRPPCTALEAWDVSCPDPGPRMCAVRRAPPGKQGPQPRAHTIIPPAIRSIKLRHRAYTNTSLRSLVQQTCLAALQTASLALERQSRSWLKHTQCGSQFRSPAKALPRLRHDGRGRRTRLLPAVKSRVFLSLHLFYAEESAFRQTECKRHRVFWSPSASTPPGGLNRGEETVNAGNDFDTGNGQKGPHSDLLKTSRLVQDPRSTMLSQHDHMAMHEVLYLKFLAFPEGHPVPGPFPQTNV
jgi:hypothetical protein